jgi:hypothetical protein
MRMFWLSISGLDFFDCLKYSSEIKTQTECILEYHDTIKTPIS